jgi:hypothetical protein
MSETKTLAPATQFMRTVPVPELPQALEAAAPGWISGGDAALTEIRSAAFSALRNIGLPHSGSEDFSFIRVGEFLPHLGAPAVATGASASNTPSPSALPARADIEKLLLPEARESYAVLVDGAYAPSLSKHGTGTRSFPWPKACRPFRPTFAPWPSRPPRRRPTPPRPWPPFSPGLPCSSRSRPSPSRPPP